MIAAIAAGASGIVFDQTQRNAAGYLMSAGAPYRTATYAFESESYDATGARGFAARELLGTIRIRAQSSRPVTTPVPECCFSSAASILARAERRTTGRARWLYCSSVQVNAGTGWILR